jgi:hypothetical protein
MIEEYKPMRKYLNSSMITPIEIFFFLSGIKYFESTYKVSLPTIIPFAEWSTA